MLLAGSVLDRVPGPKYRASLKFAELALRAPLPKAPTLRKQRGELGEGIELSLRAPLSAISGERGPMRMDAGLEQGIDWLLRARDALQASVLVLPTPAELSPGARNRERLSAYVARLREHTDATLVWAPRGPWETETAAEVAQEHGMVLAFDPVIDKRPPGPIAYARMQAMGARRSFSDAACEDALDVILGQPTERAYVALDSERSFKHAQRMQALAAELHDAS